MQITPMPGASWSNAAAAQQAAHDPRTGTSATSSAGAAKAAVGDIERSSETLDRDANGQYTPGQSERKPSEDADKNRENGNQAGQSILDLPAIGQSNELDLLG